MTFGAEDWHDVILATTDSNDGGGGYAFTTES